MSRRGGDEQDDAHAGEEQDDSRAAEGRGAARERGRRASEDRRGSHGRGTADSDDARTGPAPRRAAPGDEAPPAPRRQSAQSDETPPDSGWRPVDRPDEPSPDVGWRRVTDPDETSRDAGWGHATGTSETPTDLLRREFRQAPEGDLREGSLVVRPSLRAALGRVGVAFLVVTAFFLPFQIGTGMQAFGDDGGEPAGFWVLAFEIASNLVIPFLVSLAPALQLAFTRYILDDEGIRERVQLLSRSDKRVRWDKVTALQHRRTIVDRILQIERVDVVAYGRRGTTLHLVGLRRAPYIRGLVARQMRAQASVSGMLQND